MKSLVTMPTRGVEYLMLTIEASQGVFKIQIFASPYTSLVSEFYFFFSCSWKSSFAESLVTPSPNHTYALRIHSKEKYLHDDWVSKRARVVEEVSSHPIMCLSNRWGRRSKKSWRYQRWGSLRATESAIWASTEPVSVKNENLRFPHRSLKLRNYSSLCVSRRCRKWMGTCNKIMLNFTV